METDIYRLYFVLFIVFVIIKAIYSAFEFAIVEVNDNKVKNLAKNDVRYKKLLKLISAPSKMKSSLAVAKIFCIIFIVLFFMLSNTFISSIYVYENISNLISYIGFTDNDISIIVAMIILILLLVIVLVIFLSVFTDIIPKRIAEKNIDRLALFSVPFINFIIVVFKPITLIIDGISFVICKIFGLSTNSKNDIVTEEEILMMVEAGNETGVIEESQKDMINNIFEFEDVNICDVMTHRKDIKAIDIKSKISDVIYIAINDGFSRIPVYQDNVDNIVGIIYVKDLLCLVGCDNTEKFDVNYFLRKVMYVPEYCKCSEVFESMTIKKVQLAIVVDEYGGTAGLVSLEDLVEEIVGNIQDEYDVEEKDIEEISEGVFTIDGATDPEDVCSTLKINLPDEHNYDTMSAFIVDLIGHIPNENELATVEYQGVTFTVLIVEDNWISKIKAVTKVRT
ncbi:MAG: hemolysin family protein [Ruminococcus sp.]|nr:hemolysin family protein [Ruminococcus sp.]